VSDVRPGARIIGPIRRTTLVMCALVAVVAGCGSKESPTQSQQRSFESPKAAVEALVTAVDKGNLAELQAIFGPDSQALIDSSDPVRGRRNQQVFRVAAAERWRLEAESPERNILVVGFEDWPFPIPLVKDGGAWRFDTAGGKEEILVRRIGHNELAAIRISGAYVAAQRLYAREGHDGKPRGLYARAFTSTDGRQDGLYWEAPAGQPRSPLGDLVAGAAVEAKKGTGGEPQPFHGYYFRILTAQGAAAPGGAADYIVNGELARGFALVAWPAFYDVSGVMTFVVNQDGKVFQKDLGPSTDTEARTIDLYDPDASWTAVTTTVASGK
jgi:hypothetical protein